MTQETITAVFVAALCAAAWGCSNTSFGVSMPEEDGGVEERTGVVEMLVDGGREAKAEGGGRDAGAEEGGVVPEAGDGDGPETSVPESGLPETGPDGLTEASIPPDGGGSDAAPTPPDNIGKLCDKDEDCAHINGYCRRGICSLDCETDDQCCFEDPCYATCFDLPLAVIHDCAPLCESDTECFAGHLCVDGICAHPDDLP